jgi:hypothetical protein
MSNQRTGGVAAAAAVTAAVRKKGCTRRFCSTATGRLAIPYGTLCSSCQALTTASPHGRRTARLAKASMILVNRLNRSAITAHVGARTAYAARRMHFHGRMLAVSRIRTCAGEPN